MQYKFCLSISIKHFCSGLIVSFLLNACANAQSASEVLNNASSSSAAYVAIENTPTNPSSGFSLSSVSVSGNDLSSNAVSSADLAQNNLSGSASSNVITPIEQMENSSVASADSNPSSGAVGFVVSSSSGAIPGASSVVASSESSASSAPINNSSQSLDSAIDAAEALTLSKFILDTEVKPNSSVRLTWNSDAAVGAFSEATPVLVVNGANPGKTLCLTAAVHGDELNGIEMIRRVIFEINPANLNGTIIGVPVANIMGFRRNSRYLPDRRDWNRYFPGNTHGSSASRLAHSFFSKIIMQCDALVDLHTGSFHRTNLPQLRADLSDENVARLAQSFGVIAVLNSRGHPNSLRAAAVRAGIPSVTLEAGEPMAMQRDVVEEGVLAINTLLAKAGMYGKQKRWNRIAPVYYRSTWVRANQSGILFSKATLGQRVKEDDVLGTVTDPITNARTTIKSPYQGRILGMALDQVVLPGFAAYHIGIQTPEAILIEESQMNQVDGEMPEEDEEDGDDSGVDPVDEMDEPETGVSKAQDRMVDE
ncbi:MAG TPA: succinylglutamate desuccinylase/aspartoacylase family protein [Cellvibrio sp.]|nr:succinylglutamate desuccinylase/aspartoacylase family protein [Cellvibrio sp.]